MTKSSPDLRKYLTLGDPVNVTFTKRDGSERVMLCTQNLNQIPEHHHPKGDQSKHSENNIRVFDITKKGWRSFNVDTVKHFHVVKK